LFQPAPEIRKDFYAELPIKIRLTGTYHQFGSFVSGIASLPRIVTLHDISIVPDSKDAGAERLTLDVTAKTYRYLDEAEMAPGEHHPGPPVAGAKP
jgi:type IV pilus assembly protein PilO